MILYVGKLTLDINSDVKKKMRTITGFADFNKGIRAIACKFSAVVQGFFKTKKNNNKKQALLFALWVLLFSLLVTTLPPCTYFICRGFSSRQTSCCDTADVVNWANPHGDKHINRR